MTQMKYTKVSDSFFNGKKKFAKYTGEYLDKYNMLHKSGMPQVPDLTPGKFYKIVSEGECYNPANAFKTYFPMLMIIDNRGEVFGVPSDCFDLSDTYASSSEIFELENSQEQILNQSHDKPEVKKTSLPEPDFDEEFEEDFANSPISSPEPSQLEITMGELNHTYPNRLALNSFKNLKEISDYLTNFPDGRILIHNLDQAYFYVYHKKGNLIYSGDMLLMSYDQSQISFLKGRQEVFLFYHKKPEPTTVIKPHKIEDRTHWVKINDSVGEEFKKYYYYYKIEKLSQNDYVQLLNQLKSGEGLLIGFGSIAIQIRNWGGKLKAKDVETNEDKTDQLGLIPECIEGWANSPTFCGRVYSFKPLAHRWLALLREPTTPTCE